MVSGKDYCTDITTAGGYFENQILYRMCMEHPGHSDPAVTAGKVTIIGRTYSAAIERGAGNPSHSEVKLAMLVAEQFRQNKIDVCLNRIPFEYRFEEKRVDEIIGIHAKLNGLVGEAITAWGGGTSFNRESFCSKYLHFHKPNAFPILDRFSRIAMQKTFPGFPVDQRNTQTVYNRFCRLLLEYIRQAPAPFGWTPRSLDLILVLAGRNEKALTLKNKSSGRRDVR